MKLDANGGGPGGFDGEDTSEGARHRWDGQFDDEDVVVRALGNGCSDARVSARNGEAADRDSAFREGEVAPDDGPGGDLSQVPRFGGRITGEAWRQAKGDDERQRELLAASVGE